MVKFEDSKLKLKVTHLGRNISHLENLETVNCAELYILRLLSKAGI